MKDMKYFNANVVYAVEIDDAEGLGRHWATIKGDEALSEYLDRIQKMGDYISDVDYSTKQEDDWCRKVLNLADYNWLKNSKWCEGMGFKGIGDVIIWIVENKRA